MENKVPINRTNDDINKSIFAYGAPENSHKSRYDLKSWL